MGDQRLPLVWVGGQWKLFSGDLPVGTIGFFTPDGGILVVTEQGATNMLIALNGRSLFPELPTIEFSRDLWVQFVLQFGKKYTQREEYFARHLLQTTTAYLVLWRSYVATSQQRDIEQKAREEEQKAKKTFQKVYYVYFIAFWLLLVSAWIFLIVSDSISLFPRLTPLATGTPAATFTAPATWTPLPMLTATSSPSPTLMASPSSTATPTATITPRPRPSATFPPPSFTPTDKPDRDEGGNGKIPCGNGGPNC